MNFILKKNGYFNIAETEFINDPKLSFIYWGSLVVDNLVGPVGCSGMDDLKVLSFKKGRSEAIERRALMAGGHENAHNLVPYYNLIDQSIGEIDIKYTRYSLDKEFFSDTTGTACHFTSEQAVYKALTELLEKNCLFLFWYGKLGQKIHITEKNEYVSTLMNKGYDVDIFEVDVFAPFYTYVTVVHNNEDFIYTYGVTGDLNKVHAIQKSVQEAYLLSLKTEFENYAYSAYESERNKHIQFINWLKTFNQTIKHMSVADDKQQYTVQDIIDNLPDWIEEMNVVLLKTTVNYTKSTVLVFSRDLYNHIPLKSAINPNIKINRKTVNISEEDILTIPECMVR